MLLNNFIVEERYSAWQKKRVRTIIVNSRSRLAAHRSITGALAIAKPYERIELVGGEYFESLLISAPIEIVAADGEEPVVSSRGSCITITRDVEAYFEQVTFVSKSRSKLESAVAILNGRSVFFRCNMNSVLIGGWARPYIENCTIAESHNGYGVQIGDSAGADIWQSAIHSHQIACMEIDTRGIVNVRDNTIHQSSNLGNAVVVKAINSIADETTPPEFLACRRVVVTKCRIYISPDSYVPKDRDMSSLETPTQPCSCVLISRGACPTFSFNELTQGNIGFTFDGAGSAVLEGNCIYKQKICGILAIVDDTNFSPDSKSRGLRITGGNRIDRCYVGIDVHCSAKAAMAAGVSQQNLIPLELPSSRRAFTWFRGKDSGKVVAPPSDKDNFDDNHTFVVHGQPKTMKQLTNELRELATMVCAGHIKHFTSATVADTRYGVATSLNQLGELLEEMLNITIPPPNISERAAKLLELRRTDGVEIRDTRFSSCGLCAIRFGSSSYGVVEDCSFVSCGATCIVVCSGAHPLIIGCRFEHAKGVAIYMDNFANPLIMGNEIIGNAENGVEWRNISRGILMGNAIVGSTVNGLLLTGGCSAIVAANSIQCNNAAGVEVAEGSKPFILLNKLIGNRTAQILSSGYSAPVIAHNRITSGRNIGIHFLSCSGGTALDNAIAQNERGIVVELGADPYVYDNKIMSSNRYGVVVENNGLGTFVENTITQSGMCNILIKEGGCPVLRKNSIKFANSGGLVIVNEGSATVEYNTISGNQVANVILLDRYTDPTLTGNTISASCSGGGILCGRMSSGKFSRNIITENKQYGICIIEKAEPDITKNVIMGEQNGIIVSDEGRGSIRENSIHSCGNAGVLIQANGDPFVENNKICRSAGCGLVVTSDGKGKVIGNEFFENDVGLQCGSSAGNTTLDVDENFTTKSPGAAVARTRRSALVSKRSFAGKRQHIQSTSTANPHALVRCNKIYGNTTCGVLLECGISAVLEENEIYSNVEFGILADSRYCARRLHGKLKGIVFEGFKLPRLRSTGLVTVIRSNRIIDQRHTNIAFVDFSDGDAAIVQNQISGAPVGIYVGNNSTVKTVEGNVIENCDDGVYAESGGCGNFVDNTIRDCTGTGVYVSDEANPQFCGGNVIERCRISGVFVDAGGKGLFKEASIRNCVVGVVAYTSPPLCHAAGKDTAGKPIVTSSPAVEQCVIERNYLHGIFLCTVLSGLPLRQESWGSGKEYTKSTKLMTSTETRTFPIFRGNTIRNNRHFGVCHELYSLDGRLEESRGSDFSERTGGTCAADSFGAHVGRAFQRGTTSSRTPSPRSLQFSYRDGVSSSSEQDVEWHFPERMQRQASFVENDISNCSIGVVVGSSCNPFLLNNNIHNNDFLGILLRRGAQAMSYGCKVLNNGWVGLYAAPRSSGAFTSGEIRGNNGFCRPDTKPTDTRCFTTFSFTEAATPLPPSFKTSYDLRSSMYGDLLMMLSDYGDTVASALVMLCEVVSLSSASLSLAGTVVPYGSLDSCHSHSGGSLLEQYDRAWAADGGIGVWIALGSMTEVSDSVVEGNQNVGVFFSRGVEHQLKNMLNGVLTREYELPEVPGAEVITGGPAGPGSTRPRWLLFTSESIRGCSNLASAELTMTCNGFGTEAGKEPNPAASLTSVRTELDDWCGEPPLVLPRPPIVRRNQIFRNGYGIIIHLHQTLRAEGKQEVQGVADEGTPRASGKDKQKRRGSVGGRRASIVGAAPLPGIRRRRNSMFRKGKKVEEETPPATPSDVVNPWADVLPPHALSEKSTPEFTICVQENRIFENFTVGVVCQHVLELMCGRFVKTRHEIGVAADRYDSVCVMITLKNQSALPEKLFTLETQERLVHHAQIMKNDIYKNVREQVQVTSRYVAVTGDKERTLLQIDTLRRPFASVCSSCALLRIPLFTSLIGATSPGCFYLENNTIHDCSMGIHLIGVLGAKSTCLRRNVFYDIADISVHVEGHLSSATIGYGNIFERNGISVLVAMPEDECTEEERQWQQFIGVTTRICGNKFSSPVSVSLAFRGGGGPGPVVGGNKFANHQYGRVVFFCDSSSGSTIRGNVFQNNYAPLIVTGTEGREDDGKRTIIENNLFSQNYIGLLLCNGAAAQVARNVFEDNFRSGIEIIGKGTNPLVKQCLFVMTKDLLSLSGAREQFIYPSDGVLRVDGWPQFSVTLYPDNVITHGDVSRRLSSGVLIECESGGTIENCFFKGNQIGVDCIRGASLGVENIVYTSESELLGPRFLNCLFLQNTIAGVWLRGAHAEVGVPQSFNGRRRRSQTHPKASSFDHCFFINNTAAMDEYGDVVATDDGYATFSNSMFTGCIHGKRGSMGSFERNIFSCGGKVDTAVILHRGTRVEMRDNTISGYRRSIITHTGAWGRLERNWILGASRCVISAPFCNTLFTGNRILGAKECGVFAYGGVFVSNEIMRCQTGVVIRNPAEYKNYHVIPSVDKGTHSLLFSENKVHTCEVCGIFVAGGGRVEGNVVSNNKVNITVTCGTKAAQGSDICHIFQNAVFDGGVGLQLMNRSDALVEGNNIFDNSTYAVLMKKGARGRLMNNNISSHLNEGALAVDEGSETKLLSNTVRNQFSPVYNKLLGPQRMRERQNAADVLKTELHELEQRGSEYATKCAALQEEMRSVFHRLRESCCESDGTKMNIGTLLGNSFQKALCADEDEKDALKLPALDVRTLSTEDSTAPNDKEKSPTTPSMLSSTVRASTSSVKDGGNKDSYNIHIHLVHTAYDESECEQVCNEVQSVFDSLSLSLQLPLRVLTTTNSSAFPANWPSKQLKIFVVVVGNITDDDSLEGDVKLVRALRFPKTLAGNEEIPEEMSDVLIISIISEEFQEHADVLRTTTSGFPLAVQLQDLLSHSNPMHYVSGVSECLEELHRRAESYLLNAANSDKSDDYFTNDPEEEQSSRYSADTHDGPKTGASPRGSEWRGTSPMLESKEDEWQRLPVFGEKLNAYMSFDLIRKKVSHSNTSVLLPNVR